MFFYMMWTGYYLSDAFKYLQQLCMGLEIIISQLRCLIAAWLSKIMIIFVKKIFAFFIIWCFFFFREKLLFYKVLTWEEKFVTYAAEKPQKMERLFLLYIWKFRSALRS